MAQEAKHTPGPWTLTGGTLIGGRRKTHIAYVQEAPGLGAAAEANFRLIEAAPELLDALKALWRAVDQGTETSSDVWIDAALKYRAVIARIEGKANG